MIAVKAESLKYAISAILSIISQHSICKHSNHLLLGTLKIGLFSLSKHLIKHSVHPPTLSAGGDGSASYQVFKKRGA